MNHLFQQRLTDDDDLYSMLQHVINARS